MSDARIDALAAQVRKELAYAAYASLNGEVGLMQIRCQRGAGYDALRREFGDRLGLRWNLADNERSRGERQALRRLLTATGPDYRTSTMLGDLAQVCAVGADLEPKDGLPLVMHGLTDYSTRNGTSNLDVLPALLAQPSVDLTPYAGAMLRAARIWNVNTRRPDAALFRYLKDPRVDPAHAVEVGLVMLGEHNAWDPAPFADIGLALLERNDLSAEQVDTLLGAIAYMRAT